MRRPRRKVPVKKRRCPENLSCVWRSLPLIQRTIPSECRSERLGYRRSFLVKTLGLLFSSVPLFLAVKTDFLRPVLFWNSALANGSGSRSEKEMRRLQERRAFQSGTCRHRGFLPRSVTRGGILRRADFVWGYPLLRRFRCCSLLLRCSFETYTGIVGKRTAIRPFC